MGSGGHEFRLVGFSEDVDRRPLVFVEPLPSAKVCSACGLVPKAIALHQCEHFFCKPCYEQCRRRGEVVCPLDGEACPEDEVNWINYAARSVLAKKVLCWNQPNGCSVVTAAADISKHFHRECDHHSSRCPKCSAEILARDVCAHLESRCDDSTVSRAAEAQPRPNVVSPGQEPISSSPSDIYHAIQGIHNAISRAISSIQAEQKEIIRILKFSVPAKHSCEEESDTRNLETRLFHESLNQVMVQTAALNDQVEKFMQNVSANQQTFLNSFVEQNEALKRSLIDAVQSRINESERAAQVAAFVEAMEGRHRETNAELDRLALAIDRHYDRTSELLRSASASEETRTRNSREAAEARTHISTQDTSNIAWDKNSSAEDRQKALALLPPITHAATTHTWTIEGCESLERRAESEYEVQRWGEPVYLRGYRVSVGVDFFYEKEVCLLFDLHEGEVDRYLEWPFNLRIKWSILHPEEGRKLEYCVTPSRDPYFKGGFSRPKDASTALTTAYTMSFSTHRLEEWGFTKNDRMLLRLSLEDIPDDEEEWRRPS